MPQMREAMKAFGNEASLVHHKCKFLLPKGREVECFVEVCFDQKKALQLDWTVMIPKNSPQKPSKTVSRLMNPLDETLLDTAGLQRRVAQLVEPWHFWGLGCPFHTVDC